MNTPDILKIAETIAREAGGLIKKGFESEKSLSLKSSSIDLVTEFDHAAEVLIRERLNAAFPDHRIVGEEQGADAGESANVWYVDPIDGTTNFAHGVPHFCVSIAMYAYDRPEVGVVFNPMSGELFSGATGHGATLTSSDGRVQKLKASKTDEVGQALLATGFPYDRATSELDNLDQVGRMVKQCRGLRRMGAAALDMAYVAAGRLDGYWEFKLGIYDVAAGIVLVREAGGQVCRIPEGKAFKPEPVVHVLASGKNLKQPLLKIIAG
ncbi:MAG: inositol monophosphatase [Anaerolineae bacterium]